MRGLITARSVATDMGRLHKQQGNTEQAREYLTKALEIFDRLGTLIEPDKVRKELGGLALREQTAFGVSYNPLCRRMP